jgi:hypothetical protein
MTIEKFHSNKTTIECRYNAKQNRFRCHIAAGKRRVGPVFVRLGEGQSDAADAARVAIERTIKQGGITSSDVEHDDHDVIVHAERASGRVQHLKPPSAAKAPLASRRDPMVSKARAPKSHVAPSPKGIARAHKIAGNGGETKVAEDRYKAATKEWHAAGDAVRERHELIAALAGEG